MMATRSTMATMPKPDQHPHSTELPQLSNTDAGSSGGAPTAVGLPVGDCVGEPLGAHVSPSLVGAEVSGAAVGAPVGIVVGGCAVGAKVSGAAVGIAVGGSLHRPGIPLQSKRSTPAVVRCAHAAEQSRTSRGAFMSSTTKNATEPLLGHTLPTLCVA